MPDKITIHALDDIQVGKGRFNSIREAFVSANGSGGDLEEAILIYQGELLQRVAFAESRASQAEANLKAATDTPEDVERQNLEAAVAAAQARLQELNSARK